MSQRDSSQTEGRPGGGTFYGTYIVALAVSGIGNLMIRVGAKAGLLPRGHRQRSAWRPRSPS